MLDLIKIDERFVGIKDGAVTMVEVANKVESLKNFPITIENTVVCTEQSRLASKALNSVVEQVAQLRTAYDKPLDEALQPIMAQLNTLTGTLEDYTDKLLIAKKEAYKEKAKDFFLMLCKASCPDGDIPNWEKFYDPHWYNKTEKELNDLMVNKMADFHKVIDPKAVALFSVKGSDNIERARKALLTAKVNFDEQ